MEAITCCSRLCRLFVLVVLIFAAALSVSAVPAAAEDSIEVTCYLKADDDYVSVGNVDVDNESKAAVTCNASLKDCKGQCIGCYLDEDNDEYCFDSSGRKFER